MTYKRNSSRSTLHNRQRKNNQLSEVSIYGYIRVSSDKQTVENQRFEIAQFCAAQNIVIDGWIEETISGTFLISLKIRTKSITL